MVDVTVKGNFNNTRRFLKRAETMNFSDLLSRYGDEGVQALASATPIDSGKTADSWSYEIESSSGSVSIFWKNSNVNKGVQIAVILNFGHGTGTGGYVQGRNYISPAIQPVFDQIVQDAWKEVTRN